MDRYQKDTKENSATFHKACQVRAHCLHWKNNINSKTRLEQISLPHSQVHSEVIHPPQNIPQMQTGKENQAVTIPGKHSLVMNLQKTVAAKGSPDVLAPGKWCNLKNGLSHATTGCTGASHSAKRYGSASKLAVNLSLFNLYLKSHRVNQLFLPYLCQGNWQFAEALICSQALLCLARQKATLPAWLTAAELCLSR